MLDELALQVMLSFALVLDRKASKSRRRSKAYSVAYQARPLTHPPHCSPYSQGQAPHRCTVRPPSIPLDHQMKRRLSSFF